MQLTLGLAELFSAYVGSRRVVVQLLVGLAEFVGKHLDALARAPIYRAAIYRAANHRQKQNADSTSRAARARLHHVEPGL